MKKLFTMLLAGLMLAGCGGGGAGTNAEFPPQTDMVRYQTELLDFYCPAGATVWIEPQTKECSVDLEGYETIDGVNTRNMFTAYYRSYVSEDGMTLDKFEQSWVDSQVSEVESREDIEVGGYQGVYIRFKSNYHEYEEYDDEFEEFYAACFYLDTSSGDLNSACLIGDYRASGTWASNADEIVREITATLTVK